MNPYTSHVWIYAINLWRRLAMDIILALYIIQSGNKKFQTSENPHSSIIQDNIFTYADKDLVFTLAFIS